MEYSARSESRVVKLPGPASIGKANGNIVARSGLLSGSSLNSVIPNIISTAITKRTNAAIKR